MSKGAFDISMELRDPGLRRFFEAVPRRTGQRTITRALRKIVKPLVKEAKAKAPKDSGDLRRSIGSIADKSRTYKGSIRVGARRSARYKGHHGHLVEYGTAARVPKKGRYMTFTYNGKTVKTTRTAKMPAQPFLAPAYRNQERGMIDNFGKEIREVVIDVQNKTIKKAGL